MSSQVNTEEVLPTNSAKIINGEDAKYKKFSSKSIAAFKLQGEDCAGEFGVPSGITSSKSCPALLTKIEDVNQCGSSYRN